MDFATLCTIEPLACAWQAPSGEDFIASACDLGFCLVTPDGQGGEIFGFAEFVQAFALLVLVYTISDVRYRFRAATAPIPIWSITFWVAGFIGLGTLVTDLWFAKKYPVPLLLADQSYCQLVLALLFMTIVMLWLWYAFVRPPVFGRLNPVNFTRQLYAYILQGAESDLPVVASELRRSAWNIIKYAREKPRPSPPGFPEETIQLSAINECANSILLLMGNRKFCRHVVASAPITAIAFFRAMTDQKKYRLNIGQFASNVTSESLINKDSAIFQEDEGYYSGYLGFERPFTNALYGNFRLVESLSENKSPLDIEFDTRWNFSTSQFEAYCRAVLATYASALESNQFYGHSFALFRALEVIEHAVRDLHKLNDTPEPADAKEIKGRLRVAVDFVNKAIDLIESSGPKRTLLRHRGKQHLWQKDFYDRLADLMFELIFRASQVSTSEFINWEIQHNSVWTQFFNFDQSAARRIVLFKLRRLLYEEVRQLESLPNFKSARVLGYLLNVMGLTRGAKRDHRREEYQLRVSIISWAQRNYAKLVEKQHKVAAAALMGTVSYDEANCRLVKTYREGLDLKVPQVFLQLDRAKTKRRSSKRKDS